MRLLTFLLTLLLIQEFEEPKRARAEDREPTRHIVALDTGHTPAHPGAISASGVPEYEFNRRVVAKINAALTNTATIQPYIVASSNDLTLVGRTRLAAAHGAELFIAIHHDSAQDKYLRDWSVDGKTQRYSDEFSGYGVFFSRRNAQPEASLEFARLLGSSMTAQGFHFAKHHAEPIEGENREIVDAAAGVYRFDDLIVLRTAQMPAVLLECGVIVNRLEEKSLSTSERQEKIAEAVKAAVLAYFNRSPGRVPAATPDRQKGRAANGEMPAKGIKLSPTPSLKASTKNSPQSEPLIEPRKRSLFERVFPKLFKKEKQVTSPTTKPEQSTESNKDEEP
jgi:N-acetylmuramoyl-L-alanine amidase